MTITRGGTFIQISALQEVLARRPALESAGVNGDDFLIAPDESPVSSRHIETILLQAQGVVTVYDDQGQIQDGTILVRGRDLHPSMGGAIYVMSSIGHIEHKYSYRIESLQNRKLEVETEPQWRVRISKNFSVAPLKVLGDTKGLIPLMLAPDDFSLKVADSDVGTSGTRVCLMGNPGGRDLAISVLGSLAQNNSQLRDIGPMASEDSDAIFLLYDAPTEPAMGPVFETETWRVVGLHMFGFNGDSGRPLLSGKAGTAFANGGVSIQSVRRAIYRFIEDTDQHYHQLGLYAESTRRAGLSVGEDASGRLSKVQSVEALKAIGAKVAKDLEAQLKEHTRGEGRGALVNALSGMKGIQPPEAQREALKAALVFAAKPLVKGVPSFLLEKLVDLLIENIVVPSELDQDGAWFFNQWDVPRPFSRPSEIETRIERAVKDWEASRRSPRMRVKTLKSITEIEQFLAAPPPTLAPDRLAAYRDFLAVCRSHWDTRKKRADRIIAGGIALSLLLPLIAGLAGKIALVAANPIALMAIPALIGTLLAIWYFRRQGQTWTGACLSAWPLLFVGFAVAVANLPDAKAWLAEHVFISVGFALAAGAWAAWHFFRSRGVLAAVLGGLPVAAAVMAHLLLPYASRPLADPALSNLATFTVPVPWSQKPWRISIPDPRRMPLAHTGAIVDLVVAPGGKLAATSSTDGTVKLWDLETNALRWTHVQDGDAHHPLLAFVGGKAPESGPTKLFVIDTESRETILDLTTGQPTASNGEFGEPNVLGGMFSAGAGKMLPTLAKLFGLSPLSPVVGLAVRTKDGASLIKMTGEPNGTVRIDTDDRRSEFTKGHQAAVTALAALDSDTLVSGGSDGTVIEWKRTGETWGQSPLGGSKFDACGGACSGFIILPELILTAGLDGKARLWRRGAGGNPPVVELDHGAPIFGVSFADQPTDWLRELAASDALLTTYGQDGSAIGWILRKGGDPIDASANIRLTGKFTISRHAQPITHAAPSNAGENIVTASLDGSVRIGNGQTAWMLHLVDPTPFFEMRVKPLIRTAWQRARGITPAAVKREPEVQPVRPPVTDREPADSLRESAIATVNPCSDGTVCTLVDVFFGTTRNRSGAGAIAFSAERSQSLTLGHASVTVPKVQRARGTIPLPALWDRVVRGAPSEGDPARNFTIPKNGVSLYASEADNLNAAKQHVAKAGDFKDHAFIYVHGFGVSFENAMFRAAQISYDLSPDGRPFGTAFVFSWPSAGKTDPFSYVYDQDSADFATSHLRDFIKLVSEKTGIRNVHIVAHGMGNRTLMRALEQLAVSGTKPGNIGEIALAAPDIDKQQFETIAAGVSQLARGVTLYASSSDVAMKLSHAVRGAGSTPRAGEISSPGPAIVKGIDTIDISALSTSSFSWSHDTYADSGELLADIAKLFVTGIRPPSARSPRFQIMQQGEFQYWRYVK